MKRIFLTLLLLILLQGNNMANAIEVIGTIETSGYSSDLVINPTTKRLYAANYSSLDVIDIENKKTLLNITIPNSISGSIAIDEELNRLYVPSFSEIVVIDGKTNSIINKIPNTITPIKIAVKPGSNKIWLLNGDSITIIDDVTKNYSSGIIDLKFLKIGKSLSDILYNPDKNVLYVTDVDPNSGVSLIYVLDADTGSTLSTLGIGNSSVYGSSSILPKLSYNANLKRLFVINAGKVYIIDSTTNELKDTLNNDYSNIILSKDGSKLFGFTSIINYTYGANNIFSAYDLNLKKLIDASLLSDIGGGYKAVINPEDNKLYFISSSPYYYSPGCNGCGYTGDRVKNQSDISSTSSSTSGYIPPIDYTNKIFIVDTSPSTGESSLVKDLKTQSGKLSELIASMLKRKRLKFITDDLVDSVNSINESLDSKVETECSSKLADAFTSLSNASISFGLVCQNQSSGGHVGGQEGYRKNPKKNCIPYKLYNQFYYQFSTYYAALNPLINFTVDAKPGVCTLK